MVTAGHLLAHLDTTLSAVTGAEVVLDCEHMTSSDSSAIALLVEMHRQLSERQVKLQVTGLREQMASLIAIYGVDWILEHR